LAILYFCGRDFWMGGYRIGRQGSAIREDDNCSWRDSVYLLET
jgi:hypothetical protein